MEAVLNWSLFLTIQLASVILNNQEPVASKTSHEFWKHYLFVQKTKKTGRVAKNCYPVENRLQYVVYLSEVFCHQLLRLLHKIGVLKQF